MRNNPGDPYLIPIVVMLLVVSVPLGVFPWFVLMTVGIAAIQAGLHGFRSTGYEWIGGARLTGKYARLLGGIVIVVGVLWELIVVGGLVCAVCGDTLT